MALNQRERSSPPAKARVMQIPSKVPKIHRTRVRVLLFIDSTLCARFIKAMDRESCPLAKGNRARTDGCARMDPRVATVASIMAASHSDSDRRQGKKG